jgi:AcrR family transcriptional regulator
MGQEELSRQQQRTRKMLLQTAGRLLRDGSVPTMEQVAEAAMVSRATIYRYFPNVEALLAEAPLDDAMLEPEAVLKPFKSLDAEERVDKAEAWLHEFCYTHERQLRVMLGTSLLAEGGAGGAHTMIRRQNRRSELIAAALEPVQEQLGSELHARLSASLSLLFGTEAMIVFQDVLQLDAKAARRIKGWAARALVRAALQEAERKD